MQRSPSETPLSDLIDDYVGWHTHKSFVRFLQAFREARVGVVAIGLPPRAVGDFQASSERLISVGRSVLETVLHDPECAGVRVNSAIREGSIIINRENRKRLLAPSRSAGQRPSWRFWWSVAVEGIRSIRFPRVRRPIKVLNLTQPSTASPARGKSTPTPRTTPLMV